MTTSRHPSSVSITIACTLSLTTLASVSCARRAESQGDTAFAASLVAAHPAEPPAIVSFDKPFLFTYLAWEKRVKVESGRAIIGGEGVTPKGGGGSNVELDLSCYAELCPVARVKVGPKNTLKTLRLTLVDDTVSKPDAERHSATFNFPIPAGPTPGFVKIYASGGATLARPNDKPATGVADLSRIRQWQLAGDWGGDGPVDIEVTGITLAEPNAEAKAARLQTAKQDSEKQQAAAKASADLAERYGKRTADSPSVVAVYRVAPEIVAVAIQAGHVLPGRYEPYMAKPGDTTKKADAATVLVRGGKEVGWLIGKKKDGLVRYESFAGDPLLDEPTENVATYTVVGADGAAIKPVAVWRKSKPNDQTQPSGEVAMYHIVYLKLPAPLPSNRQYSVRFADGMNVHQPEVKFSTDESAVRSEAVHAFQIGYRPDDPLKDAFLSVWLGTGGGFEYSSPPAFRVLDAAGKTALSGKAELSKAKDATEKMWKGNEANYEKTAVYRLDFSALTAPGTYRVVVDGVGSSYPFVIGRDTWRKAFVTQMRGLLNERSGVELGMPYTKFHKPRDFYPGDPDVSVTQSSYSVVDGNKAEAYEALAKGDTGKIVPEAWGGYHDAGDWNPRRVTHMKVTMAHLELLDLFPAYFEPISLNIPKKPGVPDVLTEALFELGLFRRLQKPDGGVPYQIETNGDPIAGELSWKQSMDSYVSAPDPWASWYYAGVAAKAAKLLVKYDPKLAAAYQASAVRAMDWGERDYAKRKATGTGLDKIHWEMKDARNYAAILLYDLTGAAKWLDIFREDTLLKTDGASLFQFGTAVQSDAAFAYLRLPASRNPDPVLKARAVVGLRKQADSALAYANGNSFRLTTPDSGKPMFIGFWSTPDAIDLCRAHYATGDKRYLAGAVQACVFAGGGNPNNITYTTGVGANPIKHPFMIDYRHTGQTPPDGLTVYGNFDWPNWPDQAWALWPMQYTLGPRCKPSAYEWPVPEGYFDIYMYPATNEWTVDAWTPNVYVWGYLAARK